MWCGKFHTYLSIPLCSSCQVCILSSHCSLVSLCCSRTLHTQTQCIHLKGCRVGHNCFHRRKSLKIPAGSEPHSRFPRILSACENSRNTSNTSLSAFSHFGSQKHHIECDICVCVVVCVPLRQQSVMSKVSRLVCIFVVVSILGLDSVWPK